jgi:hypothetical protein
MRLLEFYKDRIKIILCSFFLANVAVPLVANSSIPAIHPIDTLQKISMIFEVQFGKLNTLDVNKHPVIQKSADDFLFTTSDLLPSGLSLSQKGSVQWSPTTAQINELKKRPFLLSFRAIARNGNFVAGQIRVIAIGGALSPDVTESITGSKNIETLKGSLPISQSPDSSGVENKVLEPIALVYDKTAGWDTKKEDEAFDITFKATGGSGDFKFELLEPQFLMENLDQYGSFSWTPDFDFVGADEKVKSVLLKIKVFDTEGNAKTETIPMYVEHVNRAPIVNELLAFYIQYNTENVYQLKKTGIAFDPDGDSIIFNPILKELPQGMTLSKAGQITWNPSRRQVNYLYTDPIYLSFTVEDFPAGAKSIGQIRIEVSQADLPPEIAIIPNKLHFEIREDEELHLSFFIADPNGESDLLAFSFVTENSNIPADALIKKDDWLYEFIWTPGYYFIDEEGEKNEFDISFFAIDKESNRAEKNILVRVEDAENILEKDRILYDQYRSVLEQAFDMVSQLNDKEKELEKKYRNAKKGKKNRAIITASLGALTGLSPIVFIKPDGQKIAAGLGGTATATIGTLEASSVIGESPSDIMSNLNYVTQKRNDILVYGNVFASKYALPVSKRDKGFQSDLRSLSIQLNLQEIAKLELDATWENSKKGTSRNIKKIFKDFNEDPRFEANYE